MGIKKFIRDQKPLTISLISFLLMLAIVITVGLTGGNHIIRYLQVQLMEHGIMHNEDVIKGLRPLLERALQDGKPINRVISDFQSFIDHAEPFGVRLFLIDRKRNLVIADSATAKKLPFPVNRLLGAPARQLDGTPISDLGHWRGAAWRVNKAGNIELLSLRNIDTDGPAWTLGVSSDLSELLSFMDELHFHLDTVLLITYGIIGLLGFMMLRWVGRRYESGLEEQVVQRTNELESVHQKLLEHARLATIGQTASVMAHEMRNPLASMKLALSSVSRSRTLSDRERQRVDLVVGEVDRLEAMLSDTLEYVQPIEKDETPVLLDDLLDQVLELEQPLMNECGIRLERQRCHRCSPLHLDSNKMRQVLLNLVKNAREATPDNGMISIGLQQVSQGLLLKIHNQGEPASREVLEQAFDFFFTTKARGTGLGLGLVKRVVEAHGGSVALHSDDTGVTAEVRLPL
ncbi:sensor histidine kinase [Thiolapillus brandeum]|uniref:histidine kinase n=1 Tax=Thiolapillus brandeum TaxID=1076588 RepID=A0A7U6GIQ6_9GAMM|nr:HAMP domain-containing sensor histidine kinase [Thiolapillus brandeum]BAO44374.1 hypothetical protein TBH_C1451 [Thiolapillus brandeum]